MILEAAAALPGLEMDTGFAIAQCGSQVFEHDFRCLQDAGHQAPADVQGALGLDRARRFPSEAAGRRLRIFGWIVQGLPGGDEGVVRGARIDAARRVNQ